MGIASLILGIIALVVVLIPIFPTTVGIVMGIIGIILGAIGRKNPESKGLATGGLVLSIIATVLGIAFYVACIMFLDGVSDLLG